MKNRVEETKLIEFFDNTVNAFIADPTSTDRVEFIAPRKQGEIRYVQSKQTIRS